MEALELKSYQQMGVDRETGEEIIEDKYLYLPGRPREYRFNGQNGQFNLYGERILIDEKGKTLAALTFQPISFRIFEDLLFNRDSRELWAEIFFIDSQNCVSSIMFSGTSVNELARLMEPLHYERMSLTDVIVTARPEKITSQKSGNSWFMCRFSYEIAKSDKVREYRDFVLDRPVYRTETLTPGASHKLIARPFERLLEAAIIEAEPTANDELTEGFNRAVQD